jgi:type VI secretion system protein ImpG
MKFNKYYESELLSLRKQGKKFSENNPALAPFLSDKSADPDVERLIESFAFLTAKLQQRIDDNIPEISHSFMNSIWPSCLKTQPPYSIVQFSADDAFKGVKQHIGKNQQLTFSKKNKKYHFKTTEDLLLYPIEVGSVKTTEKNDTLSLEIQVKSVKELKFDVIKPNKLRFYLSGKSRVSYLLYYLLLNNLNAVKLFAANDKAIDAKVDLSPAEINILDQVDDDKRLISYSRLQHYFMLSDIYMFLDVDIEYLSTQNLKTNDLFLKFEIDLKGIDCPSIKKDNFSLNCIPVVNIFKSSVAPITRDYKQSNYLLSLNGRNEEKYCIYQINSVSLVDKNGVEKKCYPINEYHPNVSDESLVYETNIASSVDDNKVQFSLKFPLVKDKYPNFGEKVSIEVDAYHSLVHEELAVGDISSKTDEQNDKSYSYKNITFVTPPILAPIEDNQIWRLISNLNLRFSDIKHIDDIKALIGVYNFADRHSSQAKSLTNRVVSSMKRLEIKTKDRIHKRHVIRGQEIIIYLKESHFLNEGDIYIFGSVLNEIFQSMVEVNSFNLFKLVGNETGMVLSWPLQIS